MAAPDLLRGVLRDVSRSFYLTLRLLPRGIREPIGLAYLLARATDTIADTTSAPVGERLAALDRLRAAILGRLDGPLGLRPFSDAAGSTAPQVSRGPGGEASEAERLLLRRVEEALHLLARLEDADRQLVRDVLATITSGQELDLQRFAEASAERIVALQTDAELDDYTYRVAGCVGEFWTRMCRAHVFPRAPLDDAFLLRAGVRFGQGLQLVNVLRDLPRDLRQGRCYVPAQRLVQHGLSPADLTATATMPRFRALYDEYLDLAEACLADGWAYTDALPRNHVRVRLACAWPILIGAKTLARLRSGNALDGRQRIKITRAEVRRLIVGSALRYPWRRAWRGLFDRAKSPATPAKPAA